MALFICEEHFKLYMEKVPNRVRRATQALLKRTKSVVIVGKEACQVCAGLLEREFSPTIMCADHLGQFYRKQPMELLKDPSFTLKFIRVPGTLEEEKRECVVCRTGKFPD